ncbi:MAG TPA: hypothetical protein VIL49_07080 [Capillimicrobium sp.]
MRAELVRCGEVELVYVVRGRDAAGDATVDRRPLEQRLWGRDRDPC